MKQATVKIWRCNIVYKQDRCVFYRATVLTVCILGPAFTNCGLRSPKWHRLWSISSQHPCRIKHREDVLITASIINNDIKTRNRRKGNEGKKKKRNMAKSFHAYKIKSDKKKPVRSLLRCFGWGSSWISKRVVAGKHHMFGVMGAPLFSRYCVCWGMMQYERSPW